MGTTTFNAMEIDAIGEIMNISIGASATAVSTMLGTATNITTPIVSIETRSQFNFKELEPAIGVEISYVKGLSGRNVMMFSRDDVRVIVGMMMGEEIPPEEFEMNELNESAIREVMNMMMGSSATALSEFLGYPVDISTPVSFEVHNANDFKDKYFPNDEPQVVVRFSLEIGDRLSSEFLNIMGADLAKKLLEPYADSLGTGTSEDSEQPAAEAPAAEAPAEAAAPAPGAAPAPEAAPAAETPAAADSGSDRPLDQNATDALLASLKAENSGDTSAPAQSGAAEGAGTEAPKAQPMSDEEAKAQYESMTKGQRPLSQGETDAILASLKQQASDEGGAGTSQPAAQSAPSGGSDKPLDQNATDALLASLKAQNAAPQPAQAQNAAPQAAAQPAQMQNAAAPQPVQAQNAAPQAAPQPAQAQSAAPQPVPQLAQAPQAAAQPAQMQNTAAPQAAPGMAQQGYAPQGYPQQGYAPQQPYMQQPYYAPQPQAYAPQPDPAMAKLLKYPSP